MARNMNRKDWIKSSGAFFAGGMSLMTTGFVPTIKSTNEIKKMISSSRYFISDEEYDRIAPQQLDARLNANENPFGPSQKAKEALIKAIDSGNRYSFGPLRELVGKISEHEGITNDQILLAAGSSPILTAGAIYYSQLGGNIVTGDPSYSDMPRRIEEFGGEVRWVPLTSEFKLDLEAMESKIDENTNMVYICNPNNPTATVLDASELMTFCKRVSKKTTVFIDEAYIEYMEDMDAMSMMSLVKDGYDVIIARTFSKLYGFAGLRVGYMVAPEKIIEAFDPYTRGGMSISATSGAAALAAYLDEEYMSMIRTKTKDGKEFLYQTLKKNGYEYIPSATNFAMFPINMDTKRFREEMWKRGVGIRTWDFEDKNWCRVTIGTMKDMEAFASAFTQIS
ncbi:MAG: histidinol-phosphate transaminase [Balneolaceae bacterium]